MDKILITQTTSEELARLINEGVKKSIDDFKKELLSNTANDDLLTRSEVCALLKINASTLYLWTKSQKVKAYGIANRRYYKRSELLESLTLVK